jgi:hypothetical protein
MISRLSALDTTRAMKSAKNPSGERLGVFDAEAGVFDDRLE